MGKQELIEQLTKTKSLHEAMGYTVERAFSDGYDSGYLAASQRADELLIACSIVMNNGAKASDEHWDVVRKALAAYNEKK